MITVLLAIVLADMPTKWTCVEVRATVKLMGVEKAESTARAMGATDEMIIKAKECLKRPTHSVK